MRLVTCCLIIVLCGFAGDQAIKIKPVKHFSVSIREPSDITIGTTDDNFFILGDKAFLYETDAKGKIIRQASEPGYDIEGLCVADDKIYVSDESLRQILVYDKSSLNLLRTVQVQYNGARNLGFESIIYIPSSNHFLLATEKDPQIFFEYDKDFRNLNQFSIIGIYEVSSMTYYESSLWVLSDEQMTVFKIDPADYSIKGRWKIPVINPEGICFKQDGTMVIISDDMGKIFMFNKPVAQ